MGCDRRGRRRDRQREHGVAGTKMKTKATPTEDESAPLGPAKRHAGHSPRNISARAGAKKAWRNDAEHPLSLAYAKGQLIRGNERHTSQQRFEAGDEYRCLFETMQ